MPNRKCSIPSQPLTAACIALAILTCIAISTQAQAQTFTLLHAFRGGDGDGQNPGDGALILDGRGNLFGTTMLGGSGACDGGCGTVYRVAPSGKTALLYAFTGTNGDGKYPDGALARDAEGNFYGTTYGGGTSGSACNGYGCGTVFKLDTSGHETVLYNFSGGVDGATPYSALVLDSAGNLYGTTQDGGTYGWGTVYKVDSSGNETVLHSFDGPNGDGGDAFAGLTMDSAGNLYSTTQGGGVFDAHCLPGLAVGCGTIFKITTAGDETVLYKFTGHQDGNTPFAGVLRDGQGNLYGTSQPEGSNPPFWGAVYKLEPSGKFIVLHDFSGGAGGADPLANVIADSQGNLYGTTSAGGSGGCNYYLGGGCGTIFKLSRTGQFSILYNFMGTPDGADVSSALVMDAKGNLYGAASWYGPNNEGSVFRITP